MSNVDFTQLESVQLLKWDGVDILLINRPECKASIALLGGQLLSFEPEGEPPILWQNANADFSGSTAIRAGIPICWPWFNALSMNPPEVQKTYEDIDNPSHGTVRSARWSLLSIEELEGITEVRLGTELKEKSLFLEVRYRLGSCLEMVMTTTNKGDHGVSYCCALHSYFAISDIASVAVDGFDGAEYLDMIDGWKSKLQEGYITVEEEVDRLYPGGAKALKLLDAGWQRQIEIHSPESNSTVVWNPWVEKASRTSQMLAEDFRQFVCIETAKVGDDFVSLAAGESETLTLMLSSKSLT